MPARAVEEMGVMATVVTAAVVATAVVVASRQRRDGMSGGDPATRGFEGRLSTPLPFAVKGTTGRMRAEGPRTQSENRHQDKRLRRVL